MAVTTTPQARRPSRGYFSQVWEKRDLIWYMAMSNVKARHSRTALGVVWWVLNPLLLGIVYFFVFGVILQTRRGDPQYLGYLLSGLFAFYYTRQSMNAAAASLTSNSRLISNRQFPRMIFPVAGMIEALIGFLGSLIPFFLINGFVSGMWPDARIVWLIPIVAIHTVFNFGLSLVIAQLTIPFRDIKEVLPYVTRIWLYTSPIIFPIDVRLRALSEAWFAVLQFNPMVSILGLYRWPMLGRELDPLHIPLAIGWAVVILAVGVITFRKNERKIVRYL